mgnify:CR=1 FL=1
MTPKKQRALVIGLIAIGVLIVGFFGLRTLRAFREFRGHRPPPPFAPADAQEMETDVELIRDWMTIPYIAKTYGVPDRMLFKELRIPNEGNREKSLKELNDEYFPEQAGFVLEEVKKAINDHRPPAPPTAPAP